jgi:hypothetical protein
MAWSLLIGCKKSTESVDAVTTVILECLMADKAAISSMYDMTLPPNTVPRLLVSGGRMRADLTVFDPFAGFGFI